MTPLPSHPRLAARARLHFDRHAGQWLLLYPERGLSLNDSALGVVRLLTGEHTVGDIVARLAAAHPAARRATIAGDVVAFLERLADRALLEDGA